MARILVTDALDAEGIALLRSRGHTVVEAPDGAAKEREVPLAEAWIVRSGTRIAAADVAAARRLRAIGRAGVGVDNVDLDAATQRGIAVFHAPTGNITSAAEQAWALLLACARRVPEADRSMKEGRWERKGLEGVELAGKTLLVVGLGRIGRMMARRAQAFEMAVLGHDPFVTPEAAKGLGVEWVPLEEGLARSDAVTLHAPLTPQTQSLLDARRLALLRPHAILVNAARGGLVDLAALREALDQGRLRAAGIDVWPEEPPRDWAVAQHPRVVAAPHLGASTREAQAKAALEACARVCDYLETGDAGLAVNAQAGLDEATRPWAHLAEAMAAFAIQTLERPLEQLTVGASDGLALEPLRLHALVGALKASLETPVNAINAPGLAEERGWTSAARRVAEGDPRILRLTLRAGDGEVAVEGHHTPAYGPRVTRFDGYDVDFRPAGRFLVTRHDDVPGVLASLAAELARAGLNVGNVSLARLREGPRSGTALAVIQIDGAIPAGVRDTLRELPSIHMAHRVRVLAPGTS